jgi:hypothetical protein
MKYAKAEIPHLFVTEIDLLNHGQSAVFIFASVCFLQLHGANLMFFDILEQQNLAKLVPLICKDINKSILSHIANTGNIFSEPQRALLHKIVMGAL